MAGSIGRMFVDFVARTAGFEAGVERAKKRMSGFERQAKAMNGVLMKLGAAAGAYVGGRALLSMAEATADNIDQTAKLADRLNLSIDALGRMRHAANLSGVAADEFDGAIGKLTIRLGEAGQGSKTAIEGFERLGLNFQTLTNQSTEKQIAQIADAVNALPDPAARAAAMVDLFGKSGAALLPMLAAGSAGLGDMAAEYDKLHGSMSRVDAAQVEAANDAISRMKLALEGVRDRVVVDISPAIAAVAEVFGNWLSGAGAGVDGLNSKLETTRDTLTLIGAATDVLQRVGSFAKGVGVGLYGAEAWVTAKFTKPPQSAPEGMTPKEQSVWRTSPAQLEMRESFDKWTAQYQESFAESGRAFKRIFSDRDTGEELVKTFEKQHATAMDVAATAELRNFFGSLDASSAYAANAGRAEAAAQAMLDSFFGPLDDAATRERAALAAERALGFGVERGAEAGRALFTPVDVGEQISRPFAGGALSPIELGTRADADFQARIAGAMIKPRGEAVAEQSLSVLRDLVDKTVQTNELLQDIAEQEGLTVTP